MAATETSARGRRVVFFMGKVVRDESRNETWQALACRVGGEELGDVFSG
jgi:hypothetical protein